jgi:outer membrane lipoprotein-sorting protein
MKRSIHVVILMIVALLTVGGCTGQTAAQPPVQAVAQHHEGSVNVRSRAGEGTAVTLRLPTT